VRCVVAPGQLFLFGSRLVVEVVLVTHLSAETRHSLDLYLLETLCVGGHLAAESWVYETWLLVNSVTEERHLVDGYFEFSAPLVSETRLALVHLLAEGKHVSDGTYLVAYTWLAVRKWPTQVCT